MAPVFVGIPGLTKTILKGSSVRFQFLFLAAYWWSKSNIVTCSRKERLSCNLEVQKRRGTITRILPYRRQNQNLKSLREKKRLPLVYIN